MSELTHTPPLHIGVPVGAARGSSLAPDHAALMAELGVKPKPGWATRLPPSLASFVTNGKGMAGVILLIILIATSFAAPLVSGTIALIHDRWPWLGKHPKASIDIVLKSAIDLGGISSAARIAFRPPPAHRCRAPGHPRAAPCRTGQGR